MYLYFPDTPHILPAMVLSTNSDRFTLRQLRDNIVTTANLRVNSMALRVEGSIRK